MLQTDNYMSPTQKGNAADFIPSAFSLQSTYLSYILSITFIFLLSNFLWASKVTAEDIDNACLIDRGLSSIAMQREDLSIRTDLSDNPFALELFKRWMNAPLKAPIEAQGKAAKFFSLARRPEKWFLELGKLGGIFSSDRLAMKKFSCFKLPEQVPEELEEVICLILNSIYTANIRLAAVNKGLSEEKRRLFKEYLYPEFWGKKAFEKQNGRIFKITKLKEAMESAEKIDRKGIFEAGAIILNAISKARKILAKTDTWHKKVRSNSFITSLGPVKIGGMGPDTHHGPAVLIIDVGGNDLYRGEIASGKKGKSSVVIDLSGDDAYLGGDFTQGSGFWGVGTLLDLEGDDFYRADNCSQGAGLFGLGILMDNMGSDTYSGDSFVQAAASWGWGGLIDLDGEDVYQCAYSGQAYSEVLGISCLCDLNGNDKYISGAKTPDPREDDMNKSLSQGFAFGMRNIAAGGFALLADRAGSDIYQCQYFGQGASYWMGVGVLYDESGKDTYIARRYSQGAGIHFSLGLFMDASGNDHTSSWGVSQGCGHDYGIGILVNEAGDDTYVSDWLSMGASEANGVGVFVDNSGNDGYETRAGMAAGRFVKKRRAGGIGLFIDAEGDDRYSNNGADNTVWGGNRWSVGIDREEKGISGLNIISVVEAVCPAGEAQMKKIQETARLSDILTRSEKMSFHGKVEGLLTVASHWGFDRETPKKAKEKLLNLDPAKSIAVLTGFLDTPDIMMLLFLERLFRVHSFYAIPELIKKTGDHDPIVKARALYNLGLLKDTKAVKVCVEAMDNPSWKVRAAAVRAIGEMLDEKRLDVLMPMKDVFEEALTCNDNEILNNYFKEDKQRPRMVLSVLARAVPLDYKEYKLFSEIAAGEKGDEILQNYNRLICEHLNQSILLLKEWINAINNSGEVKKKLMPYLKDHDPEVIRTAAYSLAQMHHRPVVPELILLLKDGRSWVRDTAVLSLAMFGNEALNQIDSAMKVETPAFRIIALDILSGIKNEHAKRVIEKYVNDPVQDVKYQAREALLKMK